MHDVQIQVRVDEQADEPNVTVALTIDGGPVDSLTDGPAAWRDVLAPVRELLGEDAEQALAAVEEQIAQAVRDRETRGAEMMKKRKAASKAWSTALLGDE